MPDKVPRQKVALQRLITRKSHNSGAAPGEQENWLKLNSGADLLNMQRTVGNRSVARMVALGGRGARHGISQHAAGGPSQAFAPTLVSRKASPVIQRAKFAELMAFWKQQELGQAPEPTPKGKQPAQNLPPEPGAVPEDVKQDNPALTQQEDKGEDAKSAGGYAPYGAYAGAGKATDFDSVSTGTEVEDAKGSTGHYNNYNRFDPGDDAKGSTGHYNNYNRFDPGGDDAKGSTGHYNMAPRFSGLMDSNITASSQVSVTVSGDNSAPQDEAKGPTRYNQAPQNLLGSDESKSNGQLTISSPVSTTLTPTESSPYQAPVPRGQVVGNKTQVKYLGTDEARDEFELKVGGSVTQGGQPYDTSAMYSKFKGDGFAIYVMGQDGRFYSTSHKIGLFHHSSFLGGGAVAGAGEIKVVGGTIQYITNKSGHYWPGDRELTQTLHALEGASGFSSAKLARLMPGGGVQDPYPDGAAGFLRDRPMVGGSGNKDAIKYDVKDMEATNKGEDTTSLALVRQILQHYVGQAQQGKLRKFNKPNPEFGKTFEDLKLLVLAEFGWNEADTVTYQAVLENWNNDRPIGAVAGSQPPPVPTPSDSSLWTPTPTDSSIALASSGAGTASVSADGRDYDAELAELLKSNPSPDWNALGLKDESFGWAVKTDMGGFRSASAKDKVLLLKGEKTIDEL